MSSRVIHYFIDTNVLIQCRPLSEIDWHAFCDADEVRLIISRPVQSEIDDQKNKGGDRLARKARKASTLIREIVLSDSGLKNVREKDPVVTLGVDGMIRPDPSLGDKLDYNKPDDQLVGIVHAFACANPEESAYLLTHDTGPLVTARALRVRFTPVPDEWLLPPEPSEADKKLRNLEAEIARLKDHEPKFTLSCLNEEKQEATRLDFDVVRYKALTDAETSMLMRKLEQRMPQAKDFGVREPAERAPQNLSNLMAFKEVFVPATDEQISKYRSEYQKWLKSCTSFFRTLHGNLNGRHATPEFKLSITNIGTRPANDALLTFRAKGDLRIMPPPYQSDDGDDSDTDDGAKIALPAPPQPPRGHWESVAANFLSSLTGLERHAALFTKGRLMDAVALRDFHPEQRDPNGFYYKPCRPSAPGEDFSLECQQWRHGLEPESFFGQIHFAENVDRVSGAIECCIHAQNISTPLIETIPVSIRIRKGHILAIAEDLISQV